MFKLSKLERERLKDRLTYALVRSLKWNQLRLLVRQKDDLFREAVIEAEKRLRW